MVGNGEVLQCEGLCSAAPVQFHKHVFLVDFYILPIQGADVIFGVQWLQLLGPIVVDYQKLTMDLIGQMSIFNCREKGNYLNRYL